jgi:hypothetical protein
VFHQNWGLMTREQTKQTFGDEVAALQFGRASGIVAP